MRLTPGEILVIPELDSTQDELARWVRQGNRTVIGVRADCQLKGRGRLGRTWHTPPGKALAISLALYPYTDWEQPQLLGMAIALAAAEALELSLRWPNDLVLPVGKDVKKVGGVLSEMIPSGGCRVPVIGIGINLLQESFPLEIQDVATSLLLAGREVLSADDAQSRILEAISNIPEPVSWPALEKRWMKRDLTPGKLYMLDGHASEAIGINEEGHLIVRDERGETTVPSAEAWYGKSTP